MPVQRFPLFNVDKFLAVIADDCNVLYCTEPKLLLCCVNVLLYLLFFHGFP